MYDVIQALPIGAISTSASLAGLLGTELEVLSTNLPGVTASLVPIGSVTRVKLVRASAAIASSANVAILWTTDASTGTVSAVTGAAAVKGTVAGFAILPSGTTGVSSGDYFWVAIRGPVLATTAGAVAAGAALATHSTAGAVDDTTVVFNTVVARAMAAIGSATTGVIYADVA
jgi:hypothetical protein